MIDEALELTSAITTTITAVDILKNHPDPIVRKALDMIKVHCIEPWVARHLKHGTSFTATVPEIYELTLPESGASTFGSGEGRDLRILGVPDCVGRIRAEGGAWHVELATHGKLTVGEQTITSAPNSFRATERVPVKAGDVIEFGMIQIHLLEPGTGQA